MPKPRSPRPSGPRSRSARPSRAGPRRARTERGTTYDIHTDVAFPPLAVIEAGKLADTCPEKWWNQTLTRVNDSVARLGVFEGEFHWHKHDREDELFFVLEGRLLLDFERDGKRETVELAPRQGMTIPRGVMHRTRAPSRTVVLMVEAATVTPTGD